MSGWLLKNASCKSPTTHNSSVRVEHATCTRDKSMVCSNRNPSSGHPGIGCCSCRSGSDSSEFHAPAPSQLPKLGCSQSGGARVVAKLSRLFARHKPLPVVMSMISSHSPLVPLAARMLPAGIPKARRGISLAKRAHDDEAGKATSNSTAWKSMFPAVSAKLVRSRSRCVVLGAWAMENTLSGIGTAASLGHATWSGFAEMSDTTYDPELSDAVRVESLHRK